MNLDKDRNKCEVEEEKASSKPIKNKVDVQGEHDLTLKHASTSGATTKRGSASSKAVTSDTVAKGKKGADPEAGRMIHKDSFLQGISLSSSDDEYEAKPFKENDVYEYKPFQPKITRISMGQSIQTISCTLDYDIIATIPRITIEYVYDEEDELQELIHFIELIDDTSISNLTYSVVDRQMPSDLMSFISFLIPVSIDMDLSRYSKDSEDGKLRVTIEFLHGQDVIDLIGLFTKLSFIDNPTRIQTLSACDLPSYCKVFISDSINNKKHRLARWNTLLSNEEVVLKFPFTLELNSFLKATEEMTEILIPGKLPSFDTLNDEMVQMGSQFTSTIAKEHLDALSTDDMLKDPILHFWLTW